jgi:hypothetical protein
MTPWPLAPALGGIEAPLTVTSGDGIDRYPSYVEDRRGALLGAGSALVGAAGTLLALVHHKPWLTGLLIVVLVIGILAILVALASYVGRSINDLHPKPKRKPAPPFTARWRYTSDGAEAIGAMNATQKTVNHPGYLLSYMEPRQKIVLAILVPCDPLTDAPPTTAIVKAFLELLSDEVIGELTAMLGASGEGLAWHSYGTNGVLNNLAILARSTEEEVAPAAAAILNLNDASVHYQHFQDRQRAELILLIEPRLESPLTLAQLHSWLTDALKVSDALGAFLADEVRVSTYADPEVQVGVLLEGRQDLWDLIDPGDVQSSPGTGKSRTFALHLLADRAGSEPGQAVLDAMRGLCDYGLHIHGYESQLDALR